MSSHKLMVELDLKLLLPSFLFLFSALPVCTSQDTTRICSSNKLALNCQELNKIKLSH